MKLALFADIHANLEALTACLLHARSVGAERYAFLGDLVGYGADPVAVLDLVEQLAAEGALVVLGNHDSAVIGRGVDPMNGSAQAAIDWTREQLRARHLAFLEALPLTARNQNVLFVHASAASPDRWTYVTGAVEARRSLQASAADYVFCGHVHEQQLYYTTPSGGLLPFRPVAGTPIPLAGHRRWLAIVGSAGQPRDRNTSACYALADLTQARLTFFRIPYDHRTAAQKIRAAGLPERLASRLERGT